MSNTAYEKKLNEYVSLINNEIDWFFEVAAELNEFEETCLEAMRYSVSAGGKRLRPVLALAFCELYGGDAQNALSAACALEFIHAFSLIHDDLPCMDDDDYRRGKPSCHKVFGEAVALLAGNALLNSAYSVVLRDVKRSPVQKERILMFLSTGVNAMLSGQTKDMQSEGKCLSEDEILSMYRLKTGALINMACVIGYYCANSERADMYDRLNEPIKYAEALGLAFQIRDDILDVTGNADELGKPVGSDEKSGKNTYVFRNGLEKSESLAEEYTKNALSALEFFGEKADFLTELTKRLLNRKN